VTEASPDVIRVLAAVVRRGERFLLCRRPMEKRHGGLWEFPGGKMDPGEDESTAVARELREELDVEVASVGPVEWRIRDAGSPFVIEFVPVGIRGEPRCLEHLALEWVTPLESRGLPLAPADRRYLLVRTLRQEVEACMRGHGVTTALVHGSTARGEDHPGSDLDLLVAFETGRSLMDLVALQLDLQDRLERRVDLATPGGVGKGLARSILSEGVLLFGESTWPELLRPRLQGGEGP